MNKNDFFIGWGETPRADRRFFIKAGAALMVGTAGTAGAAAAFQNRPGKGQWDPYLERDWVGQLVAAPYPMLLTRDVDGNQKTALISCLGKCGVKGRFEDMAGQFVAIRGSLIQRGQHVMISVVDGPDWIRRVVAPTDISLQRKTLVTSAELSGEILDSKCWFGAMRPSSGKVHKACASLCVRGGIPPAFFAKGEAGGGALMVLTHKGEAWGESLLPLIADPVSVRGEIFKRGDQYLFDTDLARIKRL